MEELTELENKLFKRFYDNFTTESKKCVLKKPIIERVNRKTAFVNFNDVVESLGRDRDVFKRFIENYLSTSTSIDGNNILIFDLRVSEKQIMDITKSFINVYIKCPQCKKMETKIIKEDRINSIKCSNCGSKTPIQKI